MEEYIGMLTNIKNQLDELARLTFECVCSEKCEHRHKEGEEKRWQEHCKNCELWRYLG